jgi:hypothetical protein
MMKECRPLPQNTFMVETERGIIFVDAKSHREAESKGKSMGYKSVAAYETIEVHCD